MPPLRHNHHFSKGAIWASMTLRVDETLLTLSKASSSSFVRRHPSTPLAASACSLFFTPALA